MEIINNGTSCDEGKGYLTVLVYTAGGALPLQDARVKVSGYEDTLYTDNSGRTKTLSLCVPLAINSQKQGNSDTYGVFDISVEKEGYRTEKFLDVAVFDKVESVQSAYLEPLGEDAQQQEYVTINEDPRPAADRGEDNRWQ